MINGRYWLLDSAVECGVPLNVLAAPDIELFLNRKAHGLCAKEIARSIAAMVADGELAIRTQARPGQPPAANEPWTEDRILDQIGRHGIDQRCSWYRLTRRGGAEWENWAQPDWSRYNSGWTRIRSGSSTHIQAILAATAPLAHELLELERLLHSDREILPGSIKLKVHRPWRATYWKTLAQGFEFRFRVKPRDAARRGAWARWCELSRWYERPDF